MDRRDALREGLKELMREDDDFWAAAQAAHEEVLEELIEASIAESIRRDGPARVLRVLRVGDSL